MRLLRVVVIIGVVLGALFTGADRWAVGYAEDRLAERLRAWQGPTGTADVRIHGFPFLTQAIGRELERVDLTLTDVETTADGRRTRISRLDAGFHDVTLNAGYSGGTARRVEGSALIGYPDLAEALRSDATLAYGGAPGKVKITATVNVRGAALTRSVVATVSLVDDPGAKGGKTVRVRADSVPGEGLPGIENLVRKKTDFDRDLGGGLPGGFEPSALTSDETGLRLSLSGTDMALAGS